MAVLLMPETCLGQTCMISGMTMSFGTYNPRSSTPTLTTGIVTFRCAVSVPVKIKFYNSTSGAGPDSARLTSRNHQIQYKLFLDPARTAPLGNGLNGTQYYDNPAPPADTNVTVPIFGEIPPGQNGVAAGAYSDTITVEIDDE
jgi:spore coat protein U-like protein